jgi:hypothetical protein
MNSRILYWGHSGDCCKIVYLFVRYGVHVEAMGAHVDVVRSHMLDTWTSQP